MPDALDKARAGADKARSKLAAARLGGREHDVVVSTYTPGDDLVGTSGTWSAGVTLAPRPSTEIRPQFRTVDGSLVKVGDVRVSGISRLNYTEEDLAGAPGEMPPRYTIAGRTYSVVSLSGEPTEWIAVLQAEAE